MKRSQTKPNGFSLVEVLVALLLVTIVFASVTLSPSDGGRKALERTIDGFDRAVRFAQNEAILRNTIVRILVKLEKRPQEYFVQYGPAQRIKIPELADLEKLSISERESYEAKMEKFNRQFATVAEFKDQANNPEDGILIVGVGTSLAPNIITEGLASVFFYPSGERDDALFVFSSDTEMATLAVKSFNEQTIDEYYKIEGMEELDDDELADAVESKTIEIYEQWSR